MNQHALLDIKRRQISRRHNLDEKSIDYLDNRSTKKSQNNLDFLDVNE